MSGGTAVGKTYLASAIAASCSNPCYDSQRPLSVVHDRYDIVQEILPIHPSLGYEDFVSGVTIQTLDGKADFKYTDKTFLQIIRKANDGILFNSILLMASVFVTLLKGLCCKPLMGRMLCKEENLVGKVKGKVVFNKNIQRNTLHGRDDRVYCRYLFYSEDILENQILKAALFSHDYFCSY